VVYRFGKMVILTNKLPESEKYPIERGGVK